MSSKIDNLILQEMHEEACDFTLFDCRYNGLPFADADMVFIECYVGIDDMTREDYEEYEIMDVGKDLIEYYRNSRAA